VAAQSDSARGCNARDHHCHSDLPSSTHDSMLARRLPKRRDGHHQNALSASRRFGRTAAVFAARADLLPLEPPKGRADRLVKVGPLKRIVQSAFVLPSYNVKLRYRFLQSVARVRLPRVSLKNSNSLDRLAEWASRPLPRIYTSSGSTQEARAKDFGAPLLGSVRCACGLICCALCMDAPA
jgi:hypothetical protein